MSYMRKMAKAMEYLANSSKYPAGICDWAADRYSDLKDPKAVFLSIADLKHTIEYTDALSGGNYEDISQSLDNISGYLRRRETPTEVAK